MPKTSCLNSTFKPGVLLADETFCYGNAEAAIISVLGTVRQSQLEIEVQYQQK